MATSTASRTFPNIKRTSSPGDGMCSINALAKGRSGDLESASHLFKQAERNASCTGEVLAPLAHNVAVAHGRAAFSADRSGEERASLLKVGLEFARPWRLVASLADLRKAERRYAEAAILYQEALDTICDDACVEQKSGTQPACLDVAPPEAVIRKIFANAAETRMLAERYIAAPITRDGEAGGLARPSYRGFTPRVVAVPIHFEFAKSEFTSEGRKAVEDMFMYLSRQGSPTIHLIGHTDERGTDTYNQVLSEERAQSVRRYLTARGYKGDIQTSGRGKSQRFEADDPSGYTQEQRWQLDRRVELVRK